ncbi:aminoglycoside 6-adenylyltransferase [Paenibacillus solisilvae]|uniref:Aminoglycoside 6-adenylyltransferase n=1 Tax=Paenibacillus solisilvae TaxID=2486751 RepID=A0ABW0W3H8_9BACL
MRSEEVMMDLILDFARADERVRAVIMNGSRVNPDAPRDRFQDYDIVYLVTSVDDYVRDRSWISYFGELMIIQTPDEMEVPAPGENSDGKFAFLMQFIDGNRIDLTMFPVQKMANMQQDSLSKLLLDKDEIIPPLPPASSKDYLTQPPTSQQFEHCCNEFWWVSTYIVKGLWRRELSYAKFMFDGPVRDMLMKMLNWHIAIRSDFKADPGKLGKYFEKHLEPKHWAAFAATYCDADYENIWRSLYVMTSLFREIAQVVAAFFDYTYPHEDDRRVTEYFNQIRNLPQDA